MSSDSLGNILVGPAWAGLGWVGPVWSWWETESIFRILLFSLLEACWEGLSKKMSIYVIIRWTKYSQFNTIHQHDFSHCGCVKWTMSINSASGPWRLQLVSSQRPERPPSCCTWDSEVWGQVSENRSHATYRWESQQQILLSLIVAPSSSTCSVSLWQPFPFLWQ